MKCKTGVFLPVQVVEKESSNSPKMTHVKYRSRVYSLHDRTRSNGDHANDQDEMRVLMFLQEEQDAHL